MFQKTKSKYLFSFIIFFSAFHFSWSQNRLSIPPFYQKRLPIETGISSMSGSGFGLHIAIENPIFQDKTERVVSNRIEREGKEILTKIIFKDFFFGKTNEVRLGLQLAYRKTFVSGIILEPQLSYSAGYSFFYQDFTKDFNDHQIDLQIGFGYDSRLQEKGGINYFIRPGLGIDLYNSVDAKVQFVLDFGINFHTEWLWIKRSKNPWLKKRIKKPHSESEFFGSSRGNGAADSPCSNRRKQKLNTKKRKFKTGKRKFRSKKRR
ncbi:MAG: hypothetical protein N4A45_08910 [Flavobacteriales bacterium]|jgi:hypothetical protein|nr:hypothetical protein [Flavobacteriales bacterium]